MDELKGKFKNLLSKASGKPRFEGQGHRLGTAEEHGVKPKVQGQAVVASSTAAAGSSSSSSSRAAAPQQRSQRSTASPAAGVHDLKPSTEFDPFTAVIGSGAALSAGVASPPPPSPPPPPAEAGSSSSSSSAPARSPQAAPRSQPQPLEPLQQQVLLAPVTDEQLDEIRHSLALIASQPAAAAGCMQVLSKLLSNLAAAPQEAKFRHIRLGNPRISSSVVGVSGGLELLAAAGFQVHRTQPVAAAATGAGAGVDADDDFAVFLDDTQLPLVHAALQQLQAAMPAAIAATPSPPQQQQQQQQQQQRVPAPVPAAAPAAAAARPAAAVQQPVPSLDRETLVLLPAVPDTDVPAWFFERTPADVKAEYASMLSRRARGELFASKAWKDAQAGRGQAARPTVALVRVRFPEGVCLQGRFHVRERLEALYAWVTDALRPRDAGITFELVGPDRRRLDPSGSVESAQLAPAALVSFRPLGAAGVAGYQLRDAVGRPVSYLRDELLQQARAD